MSVTLDESTHSVANALHKTIANLLQLSFIQLCQQAVNFNSSLKVLGVVCLNVDEGNDIIIKLNDTVEREGDELQATVNASRGYTSGQSKSSGDVKQKLAFTTTGSVDQSRVFSKKRKNRPNGDDDYVAPPKVPHANERAGHRTSNGAECSSVVDEHSQLLAAAVSTSQAAQRVSASLAPLAPGPSTTPPPQRSAAHTRVKGEQEIEQWPSGGASAGESDVEAPRLPFGGFVRTHKVENLPFACAHCEQTFDRASRLREHALATEHLAYKCTVCSAKFKVSCFVQLRYPLFSLSHLSLPTF